MAYYRLLLSDMVDELGEDHVKMILSSFSCPYNHDIEDFLHNKAIQFYRQGIAATHLIFSEYKNKKVLVGYFAISNSKKITLRKDRLSNSLKDRIKKFSSFDSFDNTYSTAMPLIGQLSKNYTSSYNHLIEGDVLLGLALKTVKEIQRLGGGRFVYLECEDNEKLIEFYKRNGFYKFGLRQLEQDEDIPGRYLVQMLKYIDHKKNI